MSQRDPLDDFSDALFEAARRERTASTARERTARAVIAAERQRRTRRSFAALAGGIALAAGAALLLTRLQRDASVGPIQAERIAPKHARPSVAAPRRAEDESELASAPSAATSGEAAAEVAFTTLAEERVMLEHARAELEAGKPDAALSRLDLYDKVSGGHLAAEATLLRIEALSLGGRAALAAKLARRFVDSDPNGPLAERARSFIPQLTRGEPPPAAGVER